VVKRLVKDADILVENYRTGTLEKWGIGPDVLHAINPGLIIVRVTGFGQTGPYKNRPGYDYVSQAMSGLMSLNGGPDELPGGGPAKVGLAICDVMTGMYASFAVMTAIAAREKTGEGQYIDMSLLDTTIAAISHINMNYLVGGIVPKRMGTGHPSIVPYQMFQAADGPMVIAVGNNGQFAKLCTLLGLPGLAEDPRFLTNPLRVQHREALVPQLQAAFASRTIEQWIALLTPAGVPCGPLYDLKQVFEDPQVQHRDMAMRIPHPRAGSVPALRNPARLSATPPAIERAAPALGEHTRDVLQHTLGYSDAAIEQLLREGVVGA